MAARKLLRRAGRDRAGRFLVEGAQAVREALADHGPRPARVHELFVTAAGGGAAAGPGGRGPDGRGAGRPDHRAGSGVAVGHRDPAGDRGRLRPAGRAAGSALAAAPSLVVVCAGIADPGNVGTVIRVADAAGADAVLLAGDTVDPHNGKAVRASTGSVFHLPLARDRDPDAVLDACRAAGLTLLAADGAGERELYEPSLTAVLAGPVAWIFGGEAHGVPRRGGRRADHRVRIPIRGRAESLNLATAAAVCLYASVAARRG